MLPRSLSRKKMRGTSRSLQGWRGDSYNGASSARRRFRERNKLAWRLDPLIERARSFSNASGVFLRLSNAREHSSNAVEVISSRKKGCEKNSRSRHFFSQPFPHVFGEVLQFESQKRLREEILILIFLLAAFLTRFWRGSSI